MFIICLVFGLFFFSGFEVYPPPPDFTEWFFSGMRQKFWAYTAFWFLCLVGFSIGGMWYSTLRATPATPSPDFLCSRMSPSLCVLCRILEFFDLKYVKKFGLFLLASELTLDFGFGKRVAKREGEGGVVVEGGGGCSYMKKKCKNLLAFPVKGETTDLKRCFLFGLTFSRMFYQVLLACYEL
jgi:hypothetical protein